MGFDLISFVLGIAASAIAMIIALVVFGLKQASSKNKPYNWEEEAAKAMQHGPTKSRSTPPNVPIKKTK